MLMRIKFFIFILNSFISLTTNIKCPLINNNQITDYEIITESNLDQLNFTECNVKNITVLKIKPSERLILDKTINLNSLQLTSSKIFSLILGNFKGIDVELIINLSESQELALLLHIDDSSNFDFYTQNQLIDSFNCDLKKFQNFRNNFLTQVNYLILRETVRYSHQTCPFIFYNVRLQLLNLEGLSASFLHKNVLNFGNISNNEIYSQIHQLTISLYHYHLTNSLLDEQIFKNTFAIDINGQIKSIQNDLFKSFEKLRVIRFRTQNAKELLTHKNKWLNYLNLDVNLYLNQNTDKFILLTVFQTFSNVSFYDYPEKDFCFFKRFPHEKLVFPYLTPSYKTSCSCTELYLIQYSYLLEIYFNIYSEKLSSNYYFLPQYYSDDLNEHVFSKCVNSSIKTSILECNFEKRLKLCRINTAANNSIIHDELNWYVMDWQELSKYSYIGLFLYVNPILALIMILINILIISVYSVKQLKSEIKQLYTHLKIHLISIILIISLNFFDLIHECKYEEIFCSSINNSIYSFYINVIVIKLVKNSLNTLANISYTGFVLTRFIKITNTRNRTLTKFKEANLKTYLLVVIIVSVLLNLYSCFEYSMLDRYKSAYSNTIAVRIPFDYFKINLSDLEHKILISLQYFKIIVSDLLFFVCIILIDVLTIKFIIKNERKITNNNMSTSNKKGSKRRLIKCIILNGINFFIFRLPLALMASYGLFVSFNVEKSNNVVYKPGMLSYIICRVFKFCDSLLSIFYSIFLFSFLVQFLIFYNFDKNFKESFKYLKIKCIKFFYPE